MTTENKRTIIMEFTRDTILSKFPSIIWKEIKEKVNNSEKKILAMVSPSSIEELPDEELNQVKEPSNNFTKRTYLNMTSGWEKGSFIIIVKHKDDLAELRRLFNRYELKKAIIYTE